MWPRKNARAKSSTAKRGLKPQDALGDAKNAAREQLAGQAAAGQDFVSRCASKPKRTPRRRSAISTARRIAAAPKGSDRERELQNRLDGLTKQAAKERAGLKDIELPDKKTFGQVAVGFSGAALALQLNGGGQNTQKEMLGELKKNKELLFEAVGLLKKIKDKAAAFGITERTDGHQAGASGKTAAKRRRNPPTTELHYCATGEHDQARS
jgi:hypothetical protein